MKETFQIFKILSDKTRFDIVSILSKQEEGSCALISGKFPELSQSTLSHHFKVLAEADIIKVRKEGTCHYYSLNAKLLKKAGIDIM